MKEYNYKEFEQEEINKFHDEMCTLIEEYAKGDIFKAAELIRATEEFSTVWLDTYSVTGALWELQKPAEWVCHICGQYHEEMAPKNAEVDEKYDGECPHCEFEGKMRVVEIL